MNYSEKFKASINKLKVEGRYRHFNEIERHAGLHPIASWKFNYKKSDIVVWCSNDYLGMSQNDLIINSMIDACLLYTSPSPRDSVVSRMPSSA